MVGFMACIIYILISIDRSNRRLTLQLMVFGFIMRKAAVVKRSLISFFSVQVGLTVIPDSTAGCVLGVICKLLDHTCVLSETLLPFLASCCYSLLYFLLTLEKGEAEHLRKR